MNSTPPILASAQAALQRGFALQDKAATEIVSASLAPLPDPLNPTDQATLRSTLTTPSEDPLLTGILDTLRAQTLVSSAAALIHAHDRTNDDLFRMLDPRGHG